MLVVLFRRSSSLRVVHVLQKTQRRMGTSIGEGTETDTSGGTMPCTLNAGGPLLGRLGELPVAVEPDDDEDEEPEAIEV